MNKNKIAYRLQGTRREARAIGEPEKFTVTVSHQLDEITPKRAMESARKVMYDDGYDHILFTHCAVLKGKRWVEIPMMKALGME
jgi:hypothetical protein